jgi:hypothetical protein
MKKTTLNKNTGQIAVMPRKHRIIITAEYCNCRKKWQRQKSIMQVHNCSRNKALLNINSVADDKKLHASQVLLNINTAAVYNCSMSIWNI